MGRTLPAPRLASTSATALTPHAVGLDDELDEAAAAVREEMRAKFRAEELQHYAVSGRDEDFAAAVGGGAPAAGGLVSVKGSGDKKQPMMYKKDKDGKKGGGGDRKHKHGGGGSGGKPSKKHKH